MTISKINRQTLKNESLWVIKIGSAMITNDGVGLDHDRIQIWCKQIAALIAAGKHIIIVSSGAIAEGMIRLGWASRPSALNELQAAAAVGQMGLLHAWETGFKSEQITTAQVLLTHEDAAHRTRYLNIRATLNTLIDNHVVPIINENDTVAFDEIRFGDNDTLGALVANLVEAGLYIILTDQQGLFDQDPRKYSDARLLNSVDALDPTLLDMAGGESGKLGTGGMLTKVKAARKAAQSGAATWIAFGRTDNVLLKIAQGELLGTLFSPDQTPIAAKKRWLLGQTQVKGSLILDEGASTALQEKGKSLLPIGIVDVKGMFLRGDLVSCTNHQGIEIGRGLVNYASDELHKIIKTPSHAILEKLGFIITPEAIHRDNFALNPVAK